MTRILPIVVTLILLLVSQTAWANDPLAAAILNFEGKKVPETMTETLSSIVRNEAMQIEKYKVVNQFPIKLSDVLLVLGCSVESPSCLKQVAGETDARVLIFGLVAKDGETYRLELNIFDSETGRMLNTLSRTVTDTADPIVAFRQEIETFFAEERGEARTRLAIGSSVGGAKIHIDDTFVGVVPLERKGLPAGNYEVRVTHPDYAVWKELVQLKPGGSVEVWAELTPKTAEVAVAPVEQNSVTVTTQTVDVTGGTEPERVPTTNWGAWSAIVVGGAALATSVGFGVAVERIEGKVESESEAGTLTEQRYQDLAKRASNYELAHFVLLGVGTVAATTGIVWLLVADGESSVATFDLGIGPTGATARVRF